MEIIIGVIVSCIVQFLKGKLSNTSAILAVLAVLSLAAAGVYMVLVNTGYWEAVYGILVTSGAFYAFIIQRFESGETPPTP